jgi:prepilin peptidase CpaA
VQSIAWWPTLIVVVVASLTDLWSRKVPNWLVLPFLSAGVAIGTWRGGWHGLGQSLGGLAAGALVFGFFSWMGGMGMGDVKLLAAIGAWIGPSQLLIALVLTGIAGGIMALAWAACGGFLGDLFANVGSLVLNLKERGMRPHPVLVLNNPAAHKMPYAPAIAIGTLASFFAR